MSKLARERRRARRKPPHINDKLGIGDEVRARLAFAVHGDYLQQIVEAVIDDVAEDVMLTSSYQTDGVWSVADERLALGRVLCRRLGIGCDVKFITSKRRALTKTYLETLVDEMSKVYEELYRVYGSHDVCREMAQVVCTLRRMAASVHRMTPPDTPRARRVEQEEIRA